MKRNINGKLLCCGFTTGACAAAAAKAATIMLLEQIIVSDVTLDTPKGVPFTPQILSAEIRNGYASCAVKKFSGDDPDITNGILIYARASREETGVNITGGEGIGRVTKPGLDQSVGEYAINSTPRRMIKEAVSGVCTAHGYAGGINIALSIPGGESLARRTFNPRMGIEGGLSIIGTTGIVEPMSNAALADTIRLEIKQLAASGAKDILFTPGNYGEAFAKDELSLKLTSHVSCSNFIGEALDAAAENGFERILLIGHIGKLVKLGIGAFNTHSAFGDGRMETLIACALEAGAPLETLKKMSACVTTDAALHEIMTAGILEETLAILGARIENSLSRRVPENIEIGYICFTKDESLGGALMKSSNASALAYIWREG